MTEEVNTQDVERITKSYIGVKFIDAWPQSKEGKAGYGVKYDNDYTSWSPKDVFEDAYKVIDDNEDLTRQIKSLHNDMK